MCVCGAVPVADARATVRVRPRSGRRTRSHTLHLSAFVVAHISWLHTSSLRHTVLVIAHILVAYPCLFVLCIVTAARVGRCIELYAPQAGSLTVISVAAEGCLKLTPIPRTLPPFPKHTVKDDAVWRYRSHSPYSIQSTHSNLSTHTETLYPAERECQRRTRPRASNSSRTATSPYCPCATTAAERPAVAASTRTDRRYAPFNLAE